MAQTNKQRKTIKRDKDNAEKRENQIAALDLRKGGATYQQIADTLGFYDASHAKHHVLKAIKNITVDAAMDLVRLDLERLDEYMMRCTAALRNNGDLSQIDRLMRIIDKRYAILGIANGDQKTLQGEHGITVNNTTNTTQVVMAAPESQEEFVKKMMQAVGVDPSSRAAKKYLAEERLPAPLPIKGKSEDAVVKGTVLKDKHIEK